MSPLSLFTGRTREWFAREVGAPTPVQAEGWPAIASGRDVLVSAPTGTGKTLTAFLYFLDLLAREAACGGPLPDGVRVVYISPLKALGNDIRANLRRPLAGLGLEGLVRAEVRTGDTSAADRARMARRPPHILITTPESLYLLLTSRSGRGMLRGVQAVVCDELHAVLSSKRGTHLAVSLARLDALCRRRVQRVGLSATVRPLGQAAAFLTGPRRPEAVVVAPQTGKALDIRVDLPAPSFAALPEKSVWPAIAAKAFAESCAVRTTLVFVDGRAQAEKLAHHLNAAAGQERYARTHHGCVSREQRLEAERQLREGALRALVCTSSMELGIDVGEIDLVLQVGAPAAVSSLLQRAGRAGHRPGRVSRMRVYPRTEGEALSCALAARAALEGEIERPSVPEMCMDILAQHLVSMAAAEEYTVDGALELLRETWPYRNLGRGQIEGVLAMLSGDFEHERELPVRPRLLWDRRTGRVSGDRYTRMLACSSGGAIPDRGWFSVVLPDGTRLGELDEEFVFEARQGDKFLLGAFAWRILEFTRESVVVERASADGAQSPFWRGDAAGRSPETGLFFGRLLRELDEAAAAGRLEAVLAAYPLSPEAREAAARHIVRQRGALGCLATDETLVLEHFADQAGENQLMLHCPMGRRVNRALGMLLRAEARRRTGLDVRSYEDDDGVLLWAMGGADLPDGLPALLPVENLEAVLRAMLPGEPVFSLAFRYAAGRALMLGMRRGSRQPLWVQRLRGAQTLDAALARRDHPLLWEAARESLREWMDMDALAALLRGVRAGQVRLWETHAAAPSPMALPLRRQVEAEMMYEYSPIPSAAARMAEADAERARLVTPDAAELALAARETVARNRAHLLRVLVAQGDLAPGDEAAQPEWLDELVQSGRALWIAPGLWIAAEEEALYAEALAPLSGEPPRADEARSLPGEPSCADEARALSGEPSRADEARPLFGESPRADEARPLPGESPRADEARPLPGEPSRADEARSLPGEPPRADEARSLPGESSRADEARLLPGESPRAAEARPLPGKPFRADEARPLFGEPPRADEARPLSGEPPRADEARFPSGEPPRADEAQPLFGESPRADEARPLSGEPSRADEAQPLFGEPPRADEARPLPGKPFRADEARPLPGANAALARVVRRAIRFRGAQTAASLAGRYDLPEAVFAAILKALADEGLAVAVEGGFVHRDLYAAAQSVAVRARRGAIATAPAERFAALLAQSARLPGPAAQQLRAAMGPLYGLELPAQLWEEAVLPARVSGYRPALLDALLAGGELFWRLRLADGKPLVAFFPIADEGDAFVPPAPDIPLSDDERAILRVLEEGGAQFEQRIGARLGGAPVHDALPRLASLGLIRKDSFAPVRALLAGTPAKRRRPAVRAQDTGRWERCRLPRERSVGERLERAFLRCPILCRETAAGLDWAEAAAELRRREYAAGARRGYFVEGLSGAQFVRAEDFPRVSAFLAAPDERAVCLSAADPAQAWGRLLPHMPGREFALLPQTAVVLIGGRPAAVWERGGAGLRLFEAADAAIPAFAEAFRDGRVFPAKRRVTLKEYPRDAAPLLGRAGFVREMLDFVLEK